MGNGNWMRATPAGAVASEPYGVPAPEPGSVYMTEEAVAWSAVIAALGTAYPASRMAMLDEGQIDETAMMWAQALSDVALEAIPLLQKRVLRAWTFSNPPTMGDFRKSWDAWDFYAERARAEGDGYERNDHAALPAAPVEVGPCYHAFKRQSALLTTRGQMVTCDCTNAHGIHIPATLTTDGQTWICAAHIPLGKSERTRSDCGFEWPVEREMEAPRREGRGMKNGSSSMTAAAQVLAPGAPKPRPKPSGIEIVAENLRLDLDRMDDLEMARLTGFVNWWAQNMGDVAKLTEAQIEQHYPTWLEQQEARTAARGTRL